jgi:hypothetical protein
MDTNTLIGAALLLVGVADLVVAHVAPNFTSTLRTAFTIGGAVFAALGALILFRVIQFS